jgi:hypothetical protein
MCERVDDFHGELRPNLEQRMPQSLRRPAMRRAV